MAFNLRTLRNESHIPADQLYTLTCINPLVYIEHRDEPAWITVSFKDYSPYLL